jgi:hypothetical protein
MHALSSGVFAVADSFQLDTQPRLVRVGHWDIPRPSLTRPVFNSAAVDELIARLIGLSQVHDQWVAVTCSGFAAHISRELPRRRPLPDDLATHDGLDMPGPRLDRFPLHSPLASSSQPVQDLQRTFDLLVRAREHVQVHENGALAISLHPRALRVIKRLQS